MTSVSLVNLASGSWCVIPLSVNTKRGWERMCTALSFYFCACVLHLQVSLCTPNENTPTESLARLVSMVFQWFHSTAYMMDDEVGSLVEKLKPQFVTKWLKTVCEVRFDVMVMCLLPKPVEFARVRKRKLEKIIIKIIGVVR